MTTRTIKSSPWTTVARYARSASAGFWTVKWNGLQRFFGCDCPAWRFQRLSGPQRRPCKHIAQAASQQQAA